MPENINTNELYTVQEEIASKAIVEDRLGVLSLVAGADQAFLHETTGEREMIISAVVVLEYPSMRFLYHSSAICLLYTSPSPRDLSTSRMPSSA